MYYNANSISGTNSNSRYLLPISTKTYYPTNIEVFVMFRNETVAVRADGHHGPYLWLQTNEMPADIVYYQRRDDDIFIGHTRVNPHHVHRVALVNLLNLLSLRI